MFRPAAVLSMIVVVSASIFAADAPLDVQIKDVKKQSTLSLKKKIKRAEIGAALGQIYGVIGAYLGTKNIQPLAAPFAVYKKSGADEFDVLAGFVVPDGTKGDGEIAAGELHAGTTAFAVHVGPYDKLAETCDKIRAFAKSKGYTDLGENWEFYISDPGTTKPEELKTEIYVPIEKMK